MARRSDHNREELKELAIQAGQKIIAANGFSKFSARKVAKEIGYTVGTIYNIFKDHDDLILHINAVTLNDLQAHMLANLKQSKSTEKMVKQLAHSYISFANNDFKRWNALFEHTLPANYQLPDWYSESINEMFLLLENVLSNIKSKNTPSRNARAIWASIHGITILGLTKNLDIVKADSVEVLTDSLIDGYLAGVSK